MKKLKIHVIILLITSAFMACQKVEKLSTKQNPINEKYFVTKEVAKYVAEHFNFYTSKADARINGERTIKEMLTYKDKENQPAYYVINYNDDLGYLVLSADYRQEAVLGFGEEGNFSMSDCPIQLEGIVQEEINEIDFLRENNVDSIESQPYSTWMTTTLPPGNEPIEPGDPGNCTSYDYTVGPLLTTTWSQSGNGTFQPSNINSRYNDLCPTVSCGKAVTGCVATAMAQIMNYHKRPTTYVWTSMGTTYSTPECARLCSDAGLSVSMNYNYGCTNGGTLASAASSDDVAPALKNTFGYASSTQCLNYNVGTVQNEINAYRPTYLSGSNSTAGHAWVCDGYRFMSSGCLGTTMLHMNWGWGSLAIGYYNSSNWNPLGTTYNSNRKMVIVRKN